MSVLGDLSGERSRDTFAAPPELSEEAVRSTVDFVRGTGRGAAGASAPTGRDREPTRAELAARAVQIEQRANDQLLALTDRLGLTEEQQDRIFPVLAAAHPAFHPLLIPEGAAPEAGTTAGSGAVGADAGPVYGDGTSVTPGAPIAEVESGIYDVLDTAQQASLEEEAMDREAWWEDIVGLLESDLEDSTGGEVAGSGAGENGSADAYSEEEREEASAGNEVDDVSGLLFGN